MRTDRGFTLVELIVVLTIITILTTLATVGWNRMAMKGVVESQIKTVHADMMSVRLEALYTKTPRSVVISGKNFYVYPTDATTGTPVSSKTFKYNFISTGANTPASNTITFDTSGMANGTQVTICVEALNDTLETTDAYVDSLVISQARLNLAKRAGGGHCDTSTSGVTQR
jgi:prepilin-type N-terminal cleavage/methylation domain-containing protein